jgi:hypothetical protein
LPFPTFTPSEVKYIGGISFPELDVVEMVKKRKVKMKMGDSAQIAPPAEELVA